MTYNLVEAAGIEPEAALFYIVNSDTCGAGQRFGSTFSILGLLLESFSSPWTTQYGGREPGTKSPGTKSPGTNEQGVIIMSVWDAAF